MDNLKKTIENTLINNLEALYVDGIELKSIERCSDYIAQEIKDVACEFHLWMDDSDKETTPVFMHKGQWCELKDLFEEFITNRYKEEDK